MPPKDIKLDGSVTQGTMRAARGFKCEKPISPSTIYRRKKRGETEIKADTACNIKGRKRMAEYNKAKFGMYGHSKSVARLEEAGAPVVRVGKIPFYCTTSWDHFIETKHIPKRNEAWISNFTDCSSDSGSI